MINLNQKIKLPSAVYLYAVIFLGLILVTITFIFSLAGFGKGAFSFFSFLILFRLMYDCFYYLNFSFSIDESKLNMDYGIIIKKSKSIPFDSIQNVKNTRGPLMSMLGLTKVDIWTASSSQIQIKEGQSDNIPDGRLFISKDNSEWLKDYILKKK